MRRTGYHPDAVLRAYTDPKSTLPDEVAKAVAPGIAERVAPKDGNAIGMDGQPITPPRTPGAVFEDALGGVNEAKLANDQQATGAAGGYFGLVGGKRGQFGVPDPETQPDLGPAAESLAGIRDSVVSGLVNAQRAHAIRAGTNKLLVAANSQIGGMADLVRINFFAGAGLRTNQETDEAISKMIADNKNNPNFTDRLAQIANRDTVTEEDLEYLAKNRTDKLF